MPAPGARPPAPLLGARPLPTCTIEQAHDHLVRGERPGERLEGVDQGQLFTRCGAPPRGIP